MTQPADPYRAASDKLKSEGFVFNPKTSCFERGAERVSLQWNGRVYARRRWPPAPEIADDPADPSGAYGGDAAPSHARVEWEAAAGSLMPVYTLVITSAEGHQHVMATEFADDATAIADAAGVITEEHPVIAVARGAGGDLEFLGAWDWNAGERRWTPEE